MGAETVSPTLHNISLVQPTVVTVNRTIKAGHLITIHCFASTPAEFLHQIPISQFH